MSVGVQIVIAVVGTALIIAIVYLTFKGAPPPQ